MTENDRSDYHARQSIDLPEITENSSEHLQSHLATVGNEVGGKTVEPKWRWTPKRLDVVLLHENRSKNMYHVSIYN